MAKKLEGEVWNNVSQRKFQILLVQHREYLNDPSNGQTFQKLDEEQIRWLSNKDGEMSYEMAESIIDAKDYVGGAEMRGRQSMAPLRKLGLVYLDKEDKVVVSDIGIKFINNEINTEEFFLDSLLKIQYPNPLDDSYKTWNTKPFISILHLIKRVNEKCESLGLKPKGISKDEFGIFALSLQNYYDVDRYAELVIDYRAKYNSILNEQDRKDFRERYINELLPNFKEPVKNSVEYTDNMIRYFRQTKLIHIRGKYSNTYIDLEPRRQTEIDSILDHDNGEPIVFSNVDQWLEYFSVYGTYELPFETIEKLDVILGNINKENDQIAKENNIKYEPFIYDGLDKREFKNTIAEARGERSALFYIGTILTAPNDAYIIIDEPENHLNPAIYNAIWDKLEIMRSDCQFIYISHTMDFVNSRRNYEIMTITSFIYPNMFEFNFIDPNQLELPSELLVKILGSKKPILFCEGTKDSYDYKIYQELFGSEYLVIPVESCDNVVSLTKASVRLDRFFNGKAKGIIDNDFLPTEQWGNLSENNVSVLKVNEVEMILLDEKLVKEVLRQKNSQSTQIMIQDKFNSFKEELVSLILNKKEKIVGFSMKKRFDTYANNKKIVNITDLESIKSEVDNYVDEFEFDNLLNNLNGEIALIETNNDYDKCLTICNLKDEVLKGLCNKFIDNDYANRALEVIRKNKTLANELLIKYIQ